MSEQDRYLQVFLNEWATLTRKEKRFLMRVLWGIKRDKQVVFMASFTIRKDKKLHQRRNASFDLMPINLPRETYSQVYKKLAEKFYPIELEHRKGDQSIVPRMIDRFLTKDIYFLEDDR